MWIINKSNILTVYYVYAANKTVFNWLFNNLIRYTLLYVLSAKSNSNIIPKVPTYSYNILVVPFCMYTYTCVLLLDCV